MLVELPGPHVLSNKGPRAKSSLTLSPAWGGQGKNQRNSKGMSTPGLVIIRQ